MSRSLAEINKDIQLNQDSLRAEMKAAEHRLMCDLGAKLKLARKAKGMTQLELSRAIGEARTAITNIEAGNQNLTVKMVIMCCTVLNITPDYLLGFEDDSDE